MTQTGCPAAPSPPQSLALTLPPPLPHPRPTHLPNPRLTSLCHTKCFTAEGPGKYKTSDLSVGENACVDRCVGKFFDLQKLMQEMMQQNAGSGQG